MNLDPSHELLRQGARQELPRDADSPPTGAPNSHHRLWEQGCARLAAELPPQQFNTWIRPLTPVAAAQAWAGVAEEAGGVVAVQVANRFKLDWIRSQYAGRIETVLSELAGRPMRLELAIAPREIEAMAANGAARPVLVPGAVAGRAARADGRVDGHAQGPVAAHAAAAAAAAGGLGWSAAAERPSADLFVLGEPGRQGGGAQADGEARDASKPLAGPGRAPLRLRCAAPGSATLPGPASALRPPPAATSHRLNPLLTFDTLVAGRANQMARTAALHVAGAPGEAYNPLFIYGGVGLGKTHLVHAVGNALLKDRPNARVLYLNAEQFISDVVKNYQRKTFDELKAKYHSLDLLLIDDVQFIAGKDRTQEEFFNTFEALLAKRAHIIMTSDTYPKGLADIDERLRSRFDSGLTVAIDPPELEMRVAILIAKARAEAAEMPEDVAFFIAKNVRANVRELEGALRKVLAYSRFSHKDIDIGLAREALKDLLSIQNRQISVENIQKTVADFYKIKVADMYSKKRPASIARPRQIAMYLAKDMTKKSLPEIGELFGGRDHTTVLHAVRKIGEERQRNPELNQQLHLMEQSLKG
ncbi:MAG: chromosomal replication initiator protein DnaA [Rubrivivax sp.]